MNFRKKLAILLAAAFPLGAAADQAASHAEQFATLRAIAQKAVTNSPEVLAKWHNFKSADYEMDVARGAFLPRADLTMSSGREKLKQPTNLNGDLNYNRSGYLVSLNQMLFDGFATVSEVKRLGKAKLVRYYEVLDASENVALEAAKTYLDVLRYRFLTNLAEDNYIQHRATFEQLLRRVQSGVGRRVDLEQAGSRLALAEVNLTTETANLHDVTARYQRLIGEHPPQVIFSPALPGRALPPNSKAALEKAMQRNPALLAAIENIESAQYDIDARRAAYMPRLDLKARSDNTTNYQGITGDRVNNVVEVVMSYNLFNGGSDLARSRQYVERKNIALDLREKACRDMRQTLSIAYNDTVRLREQLSFLDTQVNLIEKTRDAYRDQFNVGQRTLLDLLDTENELLSARRSAVNADSDLSLAFLRTYAGMGTLLEFLQLKQLESEMDPKADQFAAVDTSQLCPPEPIGIGQIDREALNAKALALLDTNKAIAGPGGPVPATLSSVPAAAPSGPEAAVSQQVSAWASAWASKDYNAYAAFYAPTFTPDGGLSREDWAQLRQGRITKPNSITVDIQDLKVRLDGKDRAFAEFVQNYTSDRYHDTTSKTLEFIQTGGKWLINRESSVPVGKKAGK